MTPGAPGPHAERLSGSQAKDITVRNPFPKEKK